MNEETFLKILEILKEKTPKNSPANILKNSYERTPFTILISTLLSLRTKDEITAKVCKNLFKIADTPEKLVKIPRETLYEILKPTGMYRKKAQTIQSVSKELIERFDSKVPEDKKRLLSLKGVGEKTANIVLNNAFSIPSIAVDTHVHRIPNLLGFIKTKNEKETQKELEKKVPKKYWKELNFTLVSFGQTICLPSHPKCDICPIKNYCPKNDRKERYGA